MKYHIEGYNLDDFIRKAYKKNIAIFDVNKGDDKTLSFSAGDKDHKKLSKLIRNYHHKSNGTSFQRLGKILIRNIGVFIGLSIGLTFFLVSRNFIWNIEINGNKDLSSSEIMSVLDSKGIRVGGRNNKDNKYIEDVLINQYDMIAQASVIKRGTTIIINISEKLVYNETKYEPIIAKYSGIIKNIQLETGTLNVSVGDYVNAGDILVYPYNIDTSGNQISVIPNAKIEAEIYVTGVATASKTEKIIRYTGKKSKSYIYKIGNLELFAGKGRNSFDIFSLEVYNEFISNVLPLSRDVYVYSEQELVEITNDFADLSADLIKKK